jgi:hypothetical protein
VDEQSKPFRIWTYTEASDAVPFIRVILGYLRRGFIRVWHLYRVAGYDAANPIYSEEMQFLREEGIKALDELKRLGILPYERPTRGIALFPLLVDDGGTPHQAFFVFKDSREEIDSFFFNDALSMHYDLFRCELPIPNEWRKSGAVPMLKDVLP